MAAVFDLRKTPSAHFERLVSHTYQQVRSMIFESEKWCNAAIHSSFGGPFIPVRFPFEKKNKRKKSAPKRHKIAEPKRIESNRRKTCLERNSATLELALGWTRDVLLSIPLFVLPRLSTRIGAKQTNGRSTNNVYSVSIFGCVHRFLMSFSVSNQNFPVQLRFFFLWGRWLCLS